LAYVQFVEPFHIQGPNGFDLVIVHSAE
jgi:hypothetical protein